MRLLLAVLALIAMFAAHAGAQPVRYDFAGTFSTSDTASSFAVEGGFTGGTGSYSGYVVFDTAAPGPTDFAATSAFLSIGSYSFAFADPLFSSVGAHAEPPDFSLLFLSTEEFSAANSLFELLSFTISFPTATSGIVQSPSAATGSVSINFAGDVDALNGTGTLSRFDSTAVAAVPEPASWMMMIGGFGLIGGVFRARRPRYRPAPTA